MGLLTVATCHQAAWWFSRFVGPNIDVSLFTDLDTRKIEPNLCCRNFVIFFLASIGFFLAPLVLDCWDDVTVTRSGRVLLERNDDCIFFLACKVGALYSAPSSGDDGLDGLGVAETRIWTRTCKRKYVASGRASVHKGTGMLL